MTCWPNGTKNKPAVSSPFGQRAGGWSSWHYGTDFVGFADAHSIMPGVVIATGVLPGWEAGGPQVVTDHGSGIITRHLHLDAIYVRNGQHVAEGQQIGSVGQTGNASGDCDHLEVRINGAAVDPVPWIAERLSQSGNGGVAAPAYPLPAGHYFGPKEGPAQSVSGFYSHGDDLRRWQQRMKDRGWHITVDGLYGENTRFIAIEFQREKGLTVDGLIGPATWSAAWTAPIT